MASTAEPDSGALTLKIVKNKGLPGLKRASPLGRGIPMVEDRALRRKEMRETIAELKRMALARLEIRGYEVRGKTPAQIRRLLRCQPSKPKKKAEERL